MLVSDNQKFWVKRIVVLKNKIGYIAFTHDSESMADIEKCESTTSWRFAEEIEILKEVKDERTNNRLGIRHNILHPSDSDLVYSI